MVMILLQCHYCEKKFDRDDIIESYKFNKYSCYSHINAVIPACTEIVDILNIKRESISELITCIGI